MSLKIREFIYGTFVGLLLFGGFIMGKSLQNPQSTEAYMGRGGPFSACGIEFSQGHDSYLNGVYSFNYYIARSAGTPLNTAINLQTKTFRCFCPTGLNAQGYCLSCDSGTIENRTLASGTSSLNIPISMNGQAPYCGGYQMDVAFLSVNGNSLCNTLKPDGSFNGGVWGIYDATGVNCGRVTPTPTRRPTPTVTIAPTITPTIPPYITLTPTATPTPNLSCEITNPPGTAPFPVQQGNSIDLSATVIYTGFKPRFYNWTRSCGNLTSSGTNATYTTSGVTVGDLCTITLTVSEVGGPLANSCNKIVSIIGSGLGIISGYLLTDRGTSCARDGLDSSLSGKLIELRGSVSPGSTTTDSNGYFSFIKPVGNIYSLVYTLGLLEQSSPSCVLPVRIGDELTYSNLTVVSSGLDERNFYFSPGVPPGNLAWIQVENGNVHSNNTLLLNIPSSRYFSNVENSLVTSFTDAYFDANNNQPEQSTRGVRGNHWYITYNFKINSAQLTNSFYNYFTSKKEPEVNLPINVLDLTVFQAQNGKVVTIGDGDVNNLSDVSVSSVNLPVGYTNVFYINDNLNINNSITLSGDSVAIFVVKGNLNIDSSVTNLDGVFFVDGIINTLGIVAATNVLTVNGMFYSSSTGKLFGRSRDLGSGNVNSAELINFQPKYLLNPKLLDLFGKKEYVWEEVSG